MYTTHGWISETYAEWKNFKKKYIVYDSIFMEF